jgi:hypothetical protein
MGFLDWLRRPRSIAISCWGDEPSRVRGFIDAVNADLARNRPVIVVAHFKQSLAAAVRQLTDAGVAVETRDRWLPADTASLLNRTGPVVAILAANLPEVAQPFDRARPAGAASASLRLFDLHVLPSENAHIMQFAQSLPTSSTVWAALALDGPLMRKFANPWVAATMSRLGLKEGRAIESSLVSRGLHRALKKLATQAIGNKASDSIEEWMQHNLRS